MQEQQTQSEARRASWYKGLSDEARRVSWYKDLSDEDRSASVFSSSLEPPLVPKSERALEDYTGTFGHHAFGNVSIFLNNSSDQLLLQFDGPGWIWEMEQLNDTLFIARGTEPLWYDDFVADFELDSDGIADAVTILYGDDIPPRLVRDLDWSNPPPPPDLCSPSYQKLYETIW